VRLKLCGMLMVGIGMSVVRCNLLIKLDLLVRFWT